MANTSWMDDLTNYKAQLDTNLIQGRQAYDVVVRGTQLMNMADKAMGHLEGTESQMSGALQMFDQAGSQLQNAAGFVNFAMDNLSGVVSEIKGMVEGMVQGVIDEAFKAISDMYDGVINSAKEAIGVDVAALMAIAPLAGQLLQQGMSMLPASFQSNIGNQLSTLGQHLDVCASFGNFKSLTQALSMSSVMSQANEIMQYVNVDTWIPSAAKGVLSTRFTGFQERAFVDSSGSIDHHRILTSKIGLSNSQANNVKDLIKQNEDSFKDLTFGMDPRCQNCQVDNSSEFTTW